MSVVDDPHDAAALRRLRTSGVPTQVRSKPHRRTPPPPTPDPVLVEQWQPIEFRGPSKTTGERRWTCRNHPNRRPTYCVTGQSFAEKAAVQDSIRRHVEKYHPERDAEEESRRVP